MLTLPTSKKGRILGFDIENMPLTYYAPDYPTAQITAIASAWSDNPKGTLEVCLLGDGKHFLEDVLEHFIGRLLEADIVTGHYIRKHDLPHINAALVELGMDPLPQVMVSDTKEDLIKWKGLPKNQEYLADLLEVKAKKIPMSQMDWREANRFTAKGLEKTRKRVTEDVLGQLQMREQLIREGYLKEPRLWRP